MMVKDEQAYLTFEEAAALLGVTRRTVERYGQEKTLTRYRKGVRVMFSKVEVEALKARRDADNELHPEDNQ